MIGLQVETLHAAEEETRLEGNVSRHIYVKYFTGGCNVLVLSSIAVLSVVAEVGRHRGLARINSSSSFY